MEERNRKNIIFNTLFEFVDDLHEMFGKRQKSLALFHRLMKKTQIRDDAIIQRYINVFKTFCVQNRSAILEKNLNAFINPRISFSERIFIDLKHIWKFANNEDKEAIYRYLLTVSALLDEQGGAREKLGEAPVDEEKMGDGGNVLLDMASMIEKEVEESGLEVSDNPMEMVQSLMKSGAFEKIMGSFQEKMDSGELDMGKLMGIAQQMMGANGGGDMMGQMMMMMQGMQNGKK